MFVKPGRLEMGARFALSSAESHQDGRIGKMRFDLHCGELDGATGKVAGLGAGVAWPD